MGKKVEELIVEIATPIVEGKDLEVIKSNNWKKYRPSIVMVEDNGFDFENFKSKNKSLTFGLNNVAERAHLLNGNCEIESAPGEGTKIYVRIPEAVEKVNGNF